MKKLLVSVLAIAGLVACNNEQTLVEKDNRVAIDLGAYVENATRADVAADPSTTTTLLKAFDVWGFMDEPAGVVFEGEDVTGEKGNFTYTNTQYWVPGHEYYFAALAPMNSANWNLNTEAANVHGAGIVDFINVNGTEDLIYAAAHVSTKGVAAPEKVNFQFHHLLSKVKFSFTNGFANDNAYIDVKNVRMVVPQSGSINLAQADWWSTNQWNLTDATTTLAFGDACYKTGSGVKQEAANERLTIPATATKSYEITFDVALYFGDVKAFENTLTATVEGVALEMGKAYNFKATIDATNISADGEELQPIVFDVDEVVDWVEAGDVYVTPEVAVATEDELVAAVAAGLDVVLANDIALTQTLTFGAVTRAAEVAEYTLDLNGKTLKNANTTGQTDVIIVAAGAKLTICGEGVVEAATGGDGYAVISEGELVINGGTYKSGVDANNEPNAVVYARGNGKVFVNGGYFPNDNVSKYVLNKKDADRATTVIEVRGGKFENFDPANNAAENAGTNFVADGYFSLRNGNVYEVVELAGNITLADNVVLGAPLHVRKNVVFNLNGKTISIDREGVEKQDYVFAVFEGGKLTINGEGNVAAGEANTSVAVWAYGGDVVINGGYYTNAGEGCDLIYADKGSVVEINGGEFKAVERKDGVDGTNEKYSALNCRDNSGSSFVVKGGSYYKFNPANNASENPAVNFVAAGYKAIAEGDWFVVVAQ